MTDSYGQDLVVPAASGGSGTVAGVVTSLDLTKPSNSVAQSLLSKSLEDLALEEEDNQQTAATSQSKLKVDKVT